MIEIKCPKCKKTVPLRDVFPIKNPSKPLSPNSHSWFGKDVKVETHIKTDDYFKATKKLNV